MRTFRAFERRFNGWLNCPSRNRWITTAELEVYMRKANHVCDGVMVKTLDIANVTIREDVRGKGIFKCILAHAQQHSASGAVYLENVLNPRFIKYFERLVSEDEHWSEPHPHCYLYQRGAE